MGPTVEIGAGQKGVRTAAQAHEGPHVGVGFKVRRMAVVVGHSRGEARLGSGVGRGGSESGVGSSHCARLGGTGGPVALVSKVPRLEGMVLELGAQRV